MTDPNETPICTRCHRPIEMVEGPLCDECCITWGEEKVQDESDLCETVAGYLIDLLDDRHLGEAEGPDGTIYHFKVDVTVTDREGHALAATDVTLLPSGRIIFNNLTAMKAALEEKDIPYAKACLDVLFRQAATL